LDNGQGTPQDWRDLHREYGRADNDRPHRLSGHFLWNAPGAWELGGFAEWQSGEPFTVITGVDTSGDGVVPDRPNWNPAGTLTLDPVTGNWRSFSTDRFVVPRSPEGVPAFGSMPSGGN